MLWRSFGNKNPKQGEDDEEGEKTHRLKLHFELGASHRLVNEVDERQCHGGHTFHQQSLENSRIELARRPEREERGQHLGHGSFNHLVITTAQVRGQSDKQSERKKQSEREREREREEKEREREREREKERKKVRVKKMRENRCLCE